MHDTTEGTRNTAGNSKIIHIDEQEIRSHLDQIVRGTIEDTLNSLLDAEADAICQARRYERTPDRLDTRAGYYGRKGKGRSRSREAQDHETSEGGKDRSGWLR